jgi:hypothetical protein
MVFVGALCWRIKNELPNLYTLNEIPFLYVPYEKLVTSPRQEISTISTILEYLGLDRNENVLHHNLLHKGILVGQTDASRPIDSTKIGRWRGVFMKEEIRLIDEITGNLAKRFSYEYEETQSAEKR